MHGNTKDCACPEVRNWLLYFGHAGVAEWYSCSYVDCQVVIEDRKVENLFQFAFVSCSDTRRRTYWCHMSINIPVYYNSKHSPYRKFVFIFLYSERIPLKYRWASKIHLSIFHHVMKRHPYDILRTRTGGDQRIRKISFSRTGSRSGSHKLLVHNRGLLDMNCDMFGALGKVHFIIKVPDKLSWFVGTWSTIMIISASQIRWPWVYW